MSSHLATQHTPPTPGPSMRIERLKAGEKWTLCLLAPLWGTWTHWHGEGKRSQGCFHDEASDVNDCDGCRRGLPRRWKGYLHCLHYETQEECFLEVTPMAAKSIDAQAPYRVPYRGLRLVMVRGKGDKARLTVTLLPAEQNLELLPEAKDPEKILRALWSEEFRIRKRPEQDLRIMGEVG